MAITTLEQVAGGMQPVQMFAKQGLTVPSSARAYSFWGTSGRPPAGSYNSTLAGVTLSSASAQVTGQIPYFHPSGDLRAYIARVVVTSSNPCLVVIADRLWHNGGMSITSTSAQTINSPTLPARDNAGSTNGDGVLALLEGSTAIGTGTPTITLSYTNQDGTSGRSAAAVHLVDSTNAAGQSFFLGLQAGDTGIRSIQSYTQSATRTSGTQHLVLYRPLAMIPVKIANVQHAADFETGTGTRLYHGSVPFVMALHPNSSLSNVALTLSLQYTFG